MSARKGRNRAVGLVLVAADGNGLVDVAILQRPAKLLRVLEHFQVDERLLQPRPALASRQVEAYLACDKVPGRAAGQ